MLKPSKSSKTQPRRDNISNKVGSFILEKSSSDRSIYRNIWVGSAEWRVIKIEKNYEKIMKSLIPVFGRVHSVKFKTGYLSCPCNFQSRYCILCSHIYNVVSTFEDYKESSHHWCGVRWWSIYGRIGLSSSKIEETAITIEIQRCQRSSLQLTHVLNLTHYCWDFKRVQLWIQSESGEISVCSSK